MVKYTPAAKSAASVGLRNTQPFTRALGIYQKSSAMKRDMDLVRQILLTLSNHESGYAPPHLELEGYNKSQIKYHCLIMGEAGLILAEDHTELGDTSPGASAIRLTWEGHDFIANAENEENWTQTKSALSKLGDVSFSIWGSVLTSVVKQNLGINA